MTQVDWSVLKQFVDQRGLSIQFIDLSDRYWLKAFDGQFGLECILPKASPEYGCAEFEASYKANGNKRLSLATDSDNATIQRLKMAPPGWTYQLRCTEFESSKLNSIVNKTCDALEIGDATLKFYNAAGIEITTQVELDTNCVKTILDFEPTYSYEVIGGTILFSPNVTTDTRVSVIAVPDVPAAYGGSKVMVCNINLKFIDPSNGIEADGRVSKRMNPDPNYHTNKLRVVINHPAGQKIQYALIVEHYKL